MNDYGFELPDRRHEFYDTSGELVSVNIVRHWRACDGDPEETTFDCSFDIIRKDARTRLPIGCDEAQAVSIAHKLYEEDTEATESWNETEAEYVAERRMGA